MLLGFTMLCQLHGACQRFLLARDVLVHAAKEAYGSVRRAAKLPAKSEALPCRLPGIAAWQDPCELALKGTPRQPVTPSPNSQAGRNCRKAGGGSFSVPTQGAR